MNPQPPVTRMRMAARTSSAEGGAPAEYSPADAGLRDHVEAWKARLAETDWTPWLILGLAALLRLVLLGMKPPHFDEGINGWFVDQVMHNGFYRYDPTNYHGRCTSTSCCCRKVCLDGTSGHCGCLLCWSALVAFGWL